MYYKDGLIFCSSLRNATFDSENYLHINPAPNKLTVIHNFVSCVVILHHSTLLGRQWGW